MLLNKIYKKIKINVLNLINICIYSNYIIYDLSNIGYECIINLSIYAQIAIFELNIKTISKVEYLTFELVK